MLKKIAVEQVTLGMHIHEFCGSWMDHPFWREKFVLTDPKDLYQIQHGSIREVWIDIDKGFDVQGQTREEVASRVDSELEGIVDAAQSPVPPAEPPSPRKKPQGPAHQRVSMAEEVERAARICATSKEAVVSMFHEVRMGKAIDHAAASELVEEISDSVMRNPGALISLARLKTADNYTYMHSVAVCALMVALARTLGLDEKVTREAGMAGLLHDLGKALMPMEVLNKPGRLTDEEFATIKSHPVEGHRLLLEGGTAGPIPLDVCLHHHEKIDGSGYPDGLKGDAISLHAKMGAVCDVYDAITSNRPYKAGWDPAESIRKMTEWKGHFNERVFHAFVKSIGIFPTGSLVRLSSDLLGVVIEQSPISLLIPVVKVFYSTKSGNYLEPRLIDLSQPKVGDKIVSREEAGKWGLKNLDRYWAHP